MENLTDKGLCLYFERVAKLIGDSWRLETVTRNGHTSHYLRGEAPTGAELRFIVHPYRGHNAPRGKTRIAQRFPDSPIGGYGVDPTHTRLPVAPEINVNIAKREPKAVAKDIVRRLLSDGRALELAERAAEIVERENQHIAKAASDRARLASIPGVRVGDNGSVSLGETLGGDSYLSAKVADTGNVHIHHATLGARHLAAVALLPQILAALENVANGHTVTATEQAERLIPLLRG